ncbi:MAG: CBS domain-containing protein [Nitrospirota bacterium]
MKEKYKRLEEEFRLSSESLDEIERRRQMTLRDVLASRPCEVVMIRKDSTISEAVSIMTQKSVSGLFVVDESDKLVRLFTERDIVHCVFNNISFDEVIGNISMRDIITFDPSTKVSSALAIASKQKIRHLPVVEGDKIIGMITFRDIISYLLPEVCYMAETIY